MAVETSFTSIQTVWESKGGGGDTYSRGVLFWHHGEGCGFNVQLKYHEREESPFFPISWKFHIYFRKLSSSSFLKFHFCFFFTSWDIKQRLEWKKQDWWHMSTSCHLIDDNISIIDLQWCTVKFFRNCSIIINSILTLVHWESSRDCSCNLHFIGIAQIIFMLLQLEWK